MGLVLANTTHKCSMEYRVWSAAYFLTVGLERVCGVMPTFRGWTKSFGQQGKLMPPDYILPLRTSEQ